MAISKVGSPMMWENTLIYHGKGKDANMAIYAPQEGLNAGLFQGVYLGWGTPWLKSREAAVRALNAESKKREEAYKAKWDDVCLYPCSVCGKAKCKH